MRLAEKLVHLRQVEGQVRGLDRPLTKADVARAMRAELGAGMSHAYLSQLESGTRVHLSSQSRGLLARFYKVHPGYLVDDPPGYQVEIQSPPLRAERSLRAWLANRAEEQRADPLVHRLLLRLSHLEEPRRHLALLDALLDLPLEALELLPRAGAAAPVLSQKEARLERDLSELKDRLYGPAVTGPTDGAVPG